MTQPVQTINLSVVPFSHVIRSSATVITRTVPNLLKVVIKDSKSQSVNHSSVDRWEIAVAQDFRQQTPILAGNGLVEELGELCRSFWTGIRVRCKVSWMGSGAPLDILRLWGLMRGRETGCVSMGV